MNKKIFFSGFIVSLLLMLFCFNVYALSPEPKKRLSIEAYDMLNTVPDTYLIDIRTRAEYQFVGHPLIAYLFPYMFMTKQFQQINDDCGYDYTNKNKDFISEIVKVFKKSDNLLIIGREGIRSGQAAADLVSAGFINVYHVEDGFEGRKFPFFKDQDKHKFYRQLAKRNNIYDFNHRRHYGWQWWGLPWTYVMDPKYIYPPDRSTSEK